MNNASATAVRSFSRASLSSADEDTLRRSLRPLLARCGLRVVLFGSRARGNAGSHSDIDLALRGDGAIAPDLLAQLRESFEESVLPFRVDVVDYATASPALRQAIDAEGIEWAV